MFGFHVRFTSSGCQGFHHLKAHMEGQIVVTKMVYKYMIHVLGDRWWSSATIHPWLPMMLTGFAGLAVCPSPLLRFYHLFYLRWSPAPENQVRLATLIHRHFIPSISPGKGLKTCRGSILWIVNITVFHFRTTMQCISTLLVHSSILLPVRWSITNSIIFTVIKKHALASESTLKGPIIQAHHAHQVRPCRQFANLLTGYSRESKIGDSWCNTWLARNCWVKLVNVGKYM